MDSGYGTVSARCVESSAKARPATWLVKDVKVNGDWFLMQNQWESVTDVRTP